MSADPELWATEPFIGPFTMRDALRLHDFLWDDELLRMEVEDVVRRAFALGEDLDEALWRACCEWDL